MRASPHPLPSLDSRKIRPALRSGASAGDSCATERSTPCRVLVAFSDGPIDFLGRARVIVHATNLSETFYLFT